MTDNENVVVFSFADILLGIPVWESLPQTSGLAGTIIVSRLGI